MKILVVNAGSSSLKFSVFEGLDLTLISNGVVDDIGIPGGRITVKVYRGTKFEKHVEIGNTVDHHHAFIKIVKQLKDQYISVIQDVSEIIAVGHRVVHGGEYYSDPQRITIELIKRVKKMKTSGPLHNQKNLTGIEICKRMFPKALQVAVFDTSFHQTMPPKAFRYAIPNRFYEKEGIRVYGIHGTSHKYVAEAAAAYLEKPLTETNLITVHLGNGCSMAAIQNGICIDTSVGMSPMPGLMMGTRSGDIDPSIIFYLYRNCRLKIEEIEYMLNNESGLQGLTGMNDLKDILNLMEKGNENATLAMEMYTYRIKKYIGAYFAVIGRTDAIVFTAGVGENSWFVRSRAVEGLEHLGIILDDDKNKSHEKGICMLQSDASKVKILRVPTNEELEIARSTIEVMNRMQ